eukprot:g13611.t1
MSGHDLPAIASSWPQPLLEEARLGQPLPRWAQRELHCAKTAPAVSSPAEMRPCDMRSLSATEFREPLRLVSISQEEISISHICGQIRSLGEQEFREDALEIVDGGIWTATALVDAADLLIGFVVYGVLHGAMSLRYIAITPQERGKGHGRRLVQHVCQRCSEQKVDKVTLFSKRELVSFYKAVGFEEAPEQDGDSEDDLQVPLVMCPLQLGAATEGPGSGSAPKKLREAMEKLNQSAPLIDVSDTTMSELDELLADLTLEQRAKLGKHCSCWRRTKRTKFRKSSLTWRRALSNAIAASLSSRMWFGRPL